jgi:hypothetical protein
VEDEELYDRIPHPLPYDELSLFSLCLSLVHFGIRDQHMFPFVHLPFYVFVFCDTTVLKQDGVG